MMLRSRFVAVLAFVMFFGMACLAFSAEQMDVNSLLANYEKGDKTVLATLVSAGEGIIPQLNTVMEGKDATKWMQRIGAAQVAGDLKNAQALTGLTAMLDNGNDSEKAVALRAITNIGGDQAKTIINARLNNFAGKVKSMAEKAIAELNKGVATSKSPLKTKTSKLNATGVYRLFGNETITYPFSGETTTAYLGHPEAIQTPPPTGIPVASSTPPTESPETSNSNRIAYVYFDYSLEEYVWGAIRIDFQKDYLECVSVEEHPDTWGFWTWWTPATANTQYSGGGSLYMYNQSLANDLHGTVWAQTWANWYGNYAGPSASIDNANGKVYIYTSTFAGGMYGSAPLRLGFKVKNGITIPQSGLSVSFNTKWNFDTGYSWSDASFGTNASASSILIKERVAPVSADWKIVASNNNNNLTLLAPRTETGKYACLAGAIKPAGFNPLNNPLDNNILQSPYSLTGLLTFNSGENVNFIMPSGGIGCQTSLSANVYFYKVYFNADGTLAQTPPEYFNAAPLSPSNPSQTIYWSAPPAGLSVKYLALVFSSNLVEPNFKISAIVGPKTFDLPVSFGTPDVVFALSANNLSEGQQADNNSATFGFTTSNLYPERQVANFSNHGGKIQISSLNYNGLLKDSLYLEGVTCFSPDRAFFANNTLNFKMRVPVIVNLPAGQYNYKVKITDELIHTLEGFKPVEYQSAQTVNLTVAEIKGQLANTPSLKSPVADFAGDFPWATGSGFDIKNVALSYDYSTSTIEVTMTMNGPIGNSGTPAVAEVAPRCPHSYPTNSNALDKGEFYQVFLDLNCDGAVDIYAQSNIDVTKGVTYSNGAEQEYLATTVQLGTDTVKFSIANLDTLPGLNNAIRNNNIVNVMGRSGSDYDFNIPSDQLNHRFPDYTTANPPQTNPDAGKFVSVGLYPEIESIEPAVVGQGCEQDIVIRGKNFFPETTHVDLAGPGVTVVPESLKVTNNEIKFSVLAERFASLGGRNLTVLNNACPSQAHSLDVIEVNYIKISSKRYFAVPVGSTLDIWCSGMNFGLNGIEDPTNNAPVDDISGGRFKASWEIQPGGGKPDSPPGQLNGNGKNKLIDNKVIADLKIQGLSNWNRLFMKKMGTGKVVATDPSGILSAAIQVLNSTNLIMGFVVNENSQNISILHGYRIIHDNNTLTNDYNIPAMEVGQLSLTPNNPKRITSFPLIGTTENILAITSSNPNRISFVKSSNFNNAFSSPFIKFAPISIAGDPISGRYALVGNSIEKDNLIEFSIPFDEPPVDVAISPTSGLSSIPAYNSNREIAYVLFDKFIKKYDTTNGNDLGRIDFLPQRSDIHAKKIAFTPEAQFACVIYQWGSQTLYDRMLAINTDNSVIFGSGMNDDFVLGNGATDIALSYVNDSIAPIFDNNGECISINDLSKDYNGLNNFLSIKGGTIAVPGDKTNLIISDNQWSLPDFGADNTLFTVDLYFSDSGGSGVYLKDGLEVRFKTTPTDSVITGPNEMKIDTTTNLAQFFTLTKNGAQWIVDKTKFTIPAGTYELIFTSLKDTSDNYANFSSVQNTIKFHVWNNTENLIPFEGGAVVYLDFETDRRRDINFDGNVDSPEEQPNGIADFDEDMALIGLMISSPLTNSEKDLNENIKKKIMDYCLYVVRYTYLQDYYTGKRDDNSPRIQFELGLSPDRINDSYKKHSIFSQITFGSKRESNAFGTSFMNNNFFALDHLVYIVGGPIGNYAYPGEGNTTYSGYGVFTLSVFHEYDKIAKQRVVNSYGMALQSKLSTTGIFVPVGSHPEDLTIFSDSFIFSNATAEQKRRYNEVVGAIEYAAAVLGHVASHELGHHFGLVPAYNLPTGMYGTTEDIPDVVAHGHVSDRYFNNKKTYNSMYSYVPPAIYFDNSLQNFKTPQFDNLCKAYLQQRILYNSNFIQQ